MTDAEPTTDATEFCRRVIQRGGPHTDEYDIKRFAAELRAMLDAAVRAEREKNAARLGQAERVAEAARNAATILERYKPVVVSESYSPPMTLIMDDGKEIECGGSMMQITRGDSQAEACAKAISEALAAWEAGK